MPTTAESLAQPGYIVLFSFESCEPRGGGKTNWEQSLNRSCLPHLQGFTRFWATSELLVCPCSANRMNESNPKTLDFGASKHSTVQLLMLHLHQSSTGLDYAWPTGRRSTLCQCNALKSNLARIHASPPPCLLALSVNMHAYIVIVGWAKPARATSSEFLSTHINGIGPQPLRQQYQIYLFLPCLSPLQTVLHPKPSTLWWMVWAICNYLTHLLY